MQQYRVNYPLLIGLVVGTLVCSGAVFGLWKFQMEHKSGWLISEAKKAEDEAKKSHDAKKLKDATELYSQYLSIHPEDIEARVALANAEIDLTEHDDATREDIGTALRVLESTLRDEQVIALPEAKALRRRLIGLYGRDGINNFVPALDHINLLLESDPQNAELQALRATYLARSGNVEEASKYAKQLIGYDPKTDKFDSKKASLPNDPQVYATLATIVRTKENKAGLAERIMDRAVEVNPKSADAYVQRGQLRAAWGNADGARADAEQALKLKPESTDVLLFMSDVSAENKDYEKARQYLDQAKKLHPEDVQMYQKSALLEVREQVATKGDSKAHYEKAMADIEEGLSKVSGTKQMQMLFFKAKLQLPANDVAGTKETVEKLKKLKNLRPEIIDYFEARILLAEGKWQPASEAFTKLRSKIGDFGKDTVAEVDYSLGLCYEHLGKPDLAKDKYETVLQTDPQNEPAKVGILRVTTAMRGVATDDTGGGGGDPLQKAIAEELKKPKEQQNWTKVDEMFRKLAEERKLDPTTTKLYQAQMMMMREDYDGAAKVLADAKAGAPKNLQVQRMIIQLARINPKIGPTKAMEFLTKVQAQFGDVAALRIDKADILIAMSKGEDKEKLKTELASLLAGVDQFPIAQKVELWTGMAGRYLNLGMPEEARQCLSLAADNQPNELPLRLALFSLALEAGDDDGMKDAQDKILQIVGDKNDSSWLFAEARRKLLLVRRGRLGPESLTEIRRLATQALQQRPDWFELHALLGDVELLANNGVAALGHYDRAEQLGKPAPTTVRDHIRLLVANGRYADAGKLLDRIPEGARQLLLGPLYAEILFQSNQVDAALKQARAATEADPKNAQNQYWYGQLLARSSQAKGVTEQKRKEIMGEAIMAMQRATELQPEYPDAWFALINYYAMQKDEAQAQKVLRDAQLALSGDNLPLFLARSYEVLHRWFDAETMYREIYEADPNDLGRAQQLAAFYLGPIYQRPDRRTKAAPLVNQILKAGAEKKVGEGDGNLLWARRMAAKIYSTTNEYPNLVKAEKLLASNSRDGNLLIEDKLAMAEILAPRPEPVSRLKAIGLLEEVGKVQPLNDLAEVQLGELYYAVGNNWGKYRDQMRKAIATYPNSVEARQAYVRKLLLRDDQTSRAEAADQIDKLRKLAPNNPVTFELSVRLASKLGKQQQVRADLLSRIPKIQDMQEIDQAQAQNFMAFANLLTDLGDLDSAEKIYTDLAARNPAFTYELAKFIGQHRDPDKCFAKLNEIYQPDRIPEILTVATVIARERRDKIGDKYDADIQRWLDTALRENPDSIPLLIVQGDMYDLQKKYQEAADVNRKMLTRPELTGFRRAVVLNNLAFLLAVDPSAKPGQDDPLKLIQEAVEIMGPNSDILDTRAVVLISQKQYKPAIQDLELSVTDNPTASKYFHKAVAHLRAGENRAAVEAWQKAEALGLGRDSSINRMEYELYDEMKIEIEKIRKPKVAVDKPGKAA